MKAYSFSKTCRLCLTECSNMVQIFDKNLPNLAANIVYCVSLKITENDNLPQQACANCVDQILHWASFKQICYKSDEILRKAINTDVVQINPNIYTHVQYNISSAQIIVKPDIEGYNNDISTNYRGPEMQNTSLDEQDPMKFKKKCKISDNGRKRSSLWLRDPETVKKALITRKFNERKYRELNGIQSEDEEEETLEYFLLNSEREDMIKAAASKYTCEYCLATMDTMLDYLDHQNTHEGQPAFRCDQCPEVFTHKTELKKHERKHPISCSECLKMILPRRLKNHMNLHAEKYNNSFVRDKHNNVVMQNCTTDAQHICETCGKRYSTLAAVRLHEKTHEVIEQPMYTGKNIYSVIDYSRYS